MELVISLEKNNTIDPDFINYLCQYIKICLLNSNINFDRFKGILKDNFSDFSAATILILASQNLMILDYGSYIII